MSSDVPVIIWFRRDLRLPDNPAWSAAVESGCPVVPVYIHSQAGGNWRPGAASNWWLHHALADLGLALEGVGSKLILRAGDPKVELAELLASTGATAVYWNRRYEPASIATDKSLKAWLEAERVEVRSFNSHLLFEPWTVANKSGKPFQVFTPFWKSLASQPVGKPFAFKAAAVQSPPRYPPGVELNSLGLLPDIPWDGALREQWTPTRKAGLQRLNQFVGDGVARYAERRNSPGADGTSMLSPWLAFGQVGVREIHARLVQGDGLRSRGGQVFWSEVGWREFAYHLLYHFPATVDEPLREQFRSFPWRADNDLLCLWQRGETGYPLVDAGMRQLWAHGWVHNRVRMVVASFLVKHLLQPWQDGARWFWDTLVDADLASNTLGWQWTAGCGADAAPYFRVFNPFTQGEKFDPGGEYVRRWVPELAKLPDKWVYRPWEAPADVLGAAGIRLGVDYPLPIIDHSQGRQRALRAYDLLKEQTK